jgi:hypothetical protein
MEGHLVHPVAAASGGGTAGHAGDALGPDVIGPSAEARLASLGRFGTLLGAAGLVLLAIGVAVAPARAWANVLLAGFALTGIGLAGVFFVALSHVADATWTVAWRRVPEAMTRALVGGAVLLGLLFLAYPAIYPWTSEPVGAEGSFTRLWLTRPFFVVRAVVYFAIWIGAARALVRQSRQQDEDGDPAWTARSRRTSAVFLVLFAVTCFLASVDWIMSLTPHWYSTMFGVYNFAGLFLSGLAIMAILVVWLRRVGPLRAAASDEHLHDLGKLVFAFSVFWMYIWFSQYMLIWYANMTEETVYFIPRMRGAWLPLVITNIALNWVVPFLVIMSRSSRRHGGLMMKVAAVVLVGRWLDLYIMILPAISPASPPFGLWEVGGALTVIGLFLRLFTQAFGEAAPVPRQDPFLGESLRYHA